MSVSLDEKRALREQVCGTCHYRQSFKVGQRLSFVSGRALAWGAVWREAW